MRISSNLFNNFSHYLNASIKTSWRLEIITGLFALAVFAIGCYYYLKKTQFKAKHLPTPQIKPDDPQPSVKKDIAHPDKNFPPVILESLKESEVLFRIVRYLDSKSFLSLILISKKLKKECFGQEEYVWGIFSVKNKFEFYIPSPLSRKDQVIRRFFSFGQYNNNYETGKLFFAALRTLSFRDCKKVVKRFPNTYIQFPRDTEHPDLIYNNQESFGVLQHSIHADYAEKSANIKQFCYCITIQLDDSVDPRTPIYAKAPSSLEYENTFKSATSNQLVSKISSVLPIIMRCLDPKSLRQCHLIDRQWNVLLETQNRIWSAIAKQYDISCHEELTFKENVTRYFFPFGIYYHKTGKFVATRFLEDEDMKKIVRRFPNTYLPYYIGMGRAIINYNINHKKIGFFDDYDIPYVPKVAELYRNIQNECVRINLVEPKNS